MKEGIGMELIVGNEGGNIVVARTIIYRHGQSAVEAGEIFAILPELQLRCGVQVECFVGVNIYILSRPFPILFKQNNFDSFQRFKHSIVLDLFQAHTSLILLYIVGRPPLTFPTYNHHYKYFIVFYVSQWLCSYFCYTFYSIYFHITLSGLKIQNLKFGDSSMIEPSETFVVPNITQKHMHQDITIINSHIFTTF